MMIQHVAMAGVYTLGAGPEDEAQLDKLSYDNKLI